MHQPGWNWPGIKNVAAMIILKVLLGGGVQMNVSENTVFGQCLHIQLPAVCFLHRRGSDSSR